MTRMKALAIAAIVTLGMGSVAVGLSANGLPGSSGDANEASTSAVPASEALQTGVTTVSQPDAAPVAATAVATFDDGARDDDHDDHDDDDDDDDRSGHGDGDDDDDHSRRDHPEDD